MTRILLPSHSALIVVPYFIVFSYNISILDKRYVLVISRTLSVTEKQKKRCAEIKTVNTRVLRAL